MLKSRIYYLLWITFILIANILINNLATILVVVISVVIPVIGILIYIFTSPPIFILVDFPENTDKNRTAYGNIKVINKGYLPYARISFTLHCENLLTGEVIDFPIKTSVPSLGKVDIAVKIKDDFCGKIIFTASKMKVYDVFLLVYKLRDSNISGSMLVLPDCLSSEVIVNNTNQIALDATDYSAEKAGYDMSEAFGYREYIPGDSSRSIHWKLTQKLDSLIVREGGKPISRSVLILLNTGINRGEHLPTYKARDTLMETTIALSKSLLENNMEHKIAWQDQINKEFTIFEINREDDLSNIITKLLAVSIQIDESSCIEHYVKNCGFNSFHHLVCISTELPSRELIQYEKITVLLVEDGRNQESYEEDEAMIIPISSDNIETDLLNIMI